MEPICTRVSMTQTCRIGLIIDARQQQVSGGSINRYIMVMLTSWHIIVVERAFVCRSNISSELQHFTQRHSVFGIGHIKCYYCHLSFARTEQNHWPNRWQQV